MDLTTQELLAELFDRAQKTGEQEILDAISPLVPVSKLLRKVNADTVLDESWEKILIRSNYDHKDSGIREFFGSNFLENPRAESIIEKAFIKADKKSQSAFAVNMVITGMSNLLLKHIDKWDRDAVRSFFFDTRYPVDSVRNFKSFILHPTEWDRDFLSILNHLDIDIPNDFEVDASWKSKEKGSLSSWSEVRMNSSDQWVGDILDKAGIPQLALSSEGVFIKNPDLVIGFIQERERIEKGSYSDRVFPDFVPLISEGEAADIAAEIGAIEIKPIYSIVDNGVTIASHRFEAPGQELSSDDINKAMTFLSLDTISSLRDKNSKKRVFLVPVDIINSLPYEKKPFPRDLSAALRYHRPDYLHLKGDSLSSSFLWESRHLHPEMYCRGYDQMVREVTNWGGYENPKVGDTFIHLQFATSMMKKPWLVDHLTSDEEIKAVQTMFQYTINSSDSRDKVVISDNNKDPEGQAKALKTTMDKLKNRYGSLPAFSFSGRYAFLKACADANIYSGFNSTVVIKEDDQSDEFISDLNKIRLQTRLGSIRVHAKISPDMSPKEVLMAGTRMKSDTDIGTALGILDRLPLEEVCQLASTPAQAKFLAEHYNPIDVIKMLDKKLGKNIQAVKKHIFSNDLGM